MSPYTAEPCRSAPLEWVAPDDEEERARLDAWCWGVGTATVTIPPAAPSAAPEDFDDFVFVSWNVHVGNGDVRRFVEDLRAGLHTGTSKVDQFVLFLQEAVRTEGVPAWTEYAAGAAHIGLQDRSDSVAARDILGISRDLGLSLIYVPSMRNGRAADDPAEDRGNAILATIPLSTPTAIELPGERQRRVAILARSGALNVGVIHLDAFGGPRRLWAFWTPWMREVQIRALATQLPDGPLVLGADMNTWHGPAELSLRFLRERLGLPRTTVEGRSLSVRVLDYLFIRLNSTRRVRYRQIADRYGSDHRPLVGWLE